MNESKEDEDKFAACFAAMHASDDGQGKADRAIFRRLTTSVDDGRRRLDTDRYLAVLSRARLGEMRKYSPTANPESLAMIACLFAGAESDVGGSLGAALARPRDSEGKRQVSELRVKALLRSRSRVEAFGHLKRMLPLLKGDIPAEAVAQDILYWGDQKRRQIALDYWAPTAATPGNADAQGEK